MASIFSKPRLFAKSPDEKSRGSSLKRRLWKLVLFFLLLILGCFGASNLWLNSPWGCGLLTAKLEQKTQLEWSIEGASWSPWNGLTLRSVQMLQPEELRSQLRQPIVEVESIVVRPYWQPLLRGKLQLREVTVDSPQVTLAVEMLAMVAMDSVKGQPLPPVFLGAPDLAHGAKGAGVLRDKTQLGDTQSKDLARHQVEPSGATSPQAATPRANKQAIKAGSHPLAARGQADAVTRPMAGPPLSLHIRHGELRLLSVKQEVDILSFSGLKMDISLMGEDSSGSLALDVLRVLGSPDLTHLKQGLVWQRPYLSLSQDEMSFGGLHWKIRSQLGLGARGGVMPFSVDLLLEPQKLERVRYDDRLAMDAKSLAARFRCAGVLQLPSTWRAECRAVGNGLRVAELHGGHDVLFDDVVVPFIFHQGTLRWAGVRMVGEDLAIMGNGRLSARTGVLSVTRLVVSPEVGAWSVRALRGAGVVTMDQRWWRDLDTPDRKMRDLWVTGSLLDPVVDIGYQSEELPVKGILSSTLGFVQQEVKEQAHKFEASPNSELLHLDSK